MKIAAESLAELNAQPAKPKSFERDWAGLCTRLGLRKLEMSRAMFGGNCPVCGAERAFYVWLDDRTKIRASCYTCGIKIRIKDDGPKRNWTQF